MAARISSKFSTCSLDEPERLWIAFEELIANPVGDSFAVPLSTADQGANTVAELSSSVPTVHLLGHAVIDIAGEVMIAHKVNLVMAGHPVEPDKRRCYIAAAPITIETDGWICAAATVLPGVTIGADSVVTAGSLRHTMSLGRPLLRARQQE